MLPSPGNRKTSREGGCGHRSAKENGVVGWSARTSVWDRDGSQPYTASHEARRRTDLVAGEASALRRFRVRRSPAFRGCAEGRTRLLRVPDLALRRLHHLACWLHGSVESLPGTARVLALPDVGGLARLGAAAPGKPGKGKDQPSPGLRRARARRVVCLDSGPASARGRAVAYRLGHHQSDRVGGLRRLRRRFRLDRRSLLRPAVRRNSGR